MTWERLHCWILVCDVCDDGYVPAEPSHFATQDEAVAHCRSHGWVVTEKRALCVTCAQYEACKQLGHDWGPWEKLDQLVRTEELDRRRLVRFCRICTAGEYDPPHGHG